MANHLEQLLAEWLEFKGYFVRRNVKVGKLSHGGFEAELDIIAYHPVGGRLLHIEPSIDAHTWAKREERFRKKFDAGQKYIIKDVLPWLPHDKTIEQWAVLCGSDKNHGTLGGGVVVPVWKLYRMIANEIIANGSTACNAIPETFPLLRTMQCTLEWATPDKLDQEDAEQCT